MNQNEKKISDYIDQLNAGKRPDEDEYSTDSNELKELFQTIRLVKSLKEPAMPGPGFSRKLSNTVKRASENRVKNKSWTWITSLAGISVIFALIVNFWFPIGHANIVKAMEEAYQGVKAYHGTLEIIETNAKGESVSEGKLEVWTNKNGDYYLKGLAGPTRDSITVNNGERKWQLQPDQQQVQVFPAFPDSNRFVFELGNEIKEVKAALSTKEIGTETVAGRKTTVLKVTPKGGQPYKLWIDRETKLPVQKQTAMEHAIQYKVTYTRIDFSSDIPKALLAYRVPKGYKVIEKNPEQFVNDLSEVKKAVGFIPKTLKNLPNSFFQDRIAVIPNQKTVKLIYRKKEDSKQVVVVQRKSTGEFNPAPNAILGKVKNGTAEIQSPVYENSGILSGVGPYVGVTDLSSIRWQQDGFEYAVIGNATLAELAAFTNELTNGTFKMPSSAKQSGPLVKVPYNLTVEKNDQKNADAGSSPWKLDPIFTAQVFVSLKISPQGITGDYPIDS